MTDDELIWQIGENVDRLITTDVLSYGVIGPLYHAARFTNQNAPLCLTAARLLCERVPRGGTVILTTGLILPGHHPYGETDGPIGVAVLARAIAIGLSARVLVVCDEELTAINAALLRTAELQVIHPDGLAAEDGQSRAAAAVAPLPRENEAAGHASSQWIDSLRVAAVIAVEKPGANALGVYHMVGGTDISTSVSKGQALFTAARARNVLTIGIGDRGNELGMGPIAETTRALLPFGRDCGCPCRGGVADETPADVPVVATVSNWGAYGIATCLAAILERADLIQSAELEAALFATAVREGGVDGMTGRTSPSADGIDVAVHQGVVRLLHEIYRAQSARDPSPFSTPLIKRGRQRSAVP
ncbi:MAG TPA: glutamate cyclase domain-containing protein, partial [Rhodopila sp.]|nr:glutamate cyclase domain-containing protein [Rhodopila sp.]